MKFADQLYLRLARTSSAIARLALKVSARSARRSPRYAPEMISLEERVLFSAAPVPADVIAPTDAGPAEDQVFVNFEAVSEQQASQLASSDDAEPTDTTAQQNRLELVFIDPSPDDYGQLIDDLASDRDGVQFEVVLLDGSQDGIDQISDVLAGYDQVDAVHIVSHGTDGRVKLGNTWLDANNLNGYAGQIALWQDALTSDADLLFYGCDLASNEDGRLLVDSLSALTGADVAASVDDTGHVILGGDWDLEYATGVIETDVTFSAEVQQNWSALLAASSTGTAIWVENGTFTPENNQWDGTSFGTEGSSADVGDEFRIMQGAEAPTRDEAIVVGVVGGGTIRGQMWNGSSWAALPINDLGTGSDDSSWGFDVAYEHDSGDAVLVWNDKPDLKYSVWNGSTWSVPAVVTAYSGADPQSMKIAASPDSDEMVLIINDKDKNEFALVWDGSSWGNEVALVGSGRQNHTDISVAYEQLSGHAMVVYAKDQTDVHFRTWDGSSWSAEGTVTAPAGPSGKARWTTLAGDPNSDRIVLGVLTESQDAYLAVWDGDSWGSPDKISATHDTNDRNYPNIAVAFENGNGEAIATYGVEDASVRYRTWAPGAGWSAELVGPNVGEKPTSLTLDTDPATNTIMLSVLDEGKDVSYVTWDGDSWGTSSQQEIDAGVSNKQPFLFLWDVDTSGVQVAPTLSLPGEPLEYLKGSPAKIIDPGALVSDSDSANFHTGTLTVDFTSGGTTNDRLAIRNQGTSSGEIGVSGSTVTYGGTAIGTFAGGTDGSTPLVVTFNTNATPTAVDALVRNVTYENVSASPSTANRSARFIVTDGDGGTSSAEVGTIKVRLEETGAVAVWRENGTTTPEYNLFDGASFGTEGNSANLDEWEVIQGADAPTRDETIVVGIDGGKAIRGQIWNGSSWTPLTINDLGTAKSTKSWSFDVAYESLSGDAVLLWGDNPDLKFSVWNGTSWTAASTVSAYSGAAIEHLQLASNPDSDEIVVVITDSNGDDYALVWNGSTWGNQLLLNTVNSQDVTDVSVTYEQQSGQAMVVYAKDQVDVHYRSWNGSTWSGEGTITAPVGPAGKARWTTLASDPNSDRIGLGVLTESQDAYFAVWDGTTWNASDKIAATLDTNDRGYPNISVAFESQSGDVLATYGVEDTIVRYRTWSIGGGWSEEMNGPDLTEKPTSMTLDSDPNSDRIMLSVLDENKDVNYVLWDGTTWGAATEQEIDTGQSNAQPFVFVWDRKNSPPTATDDGGAAFATNEDTSFTTGDVLANDSDPNISDTLSVLSFDTTGTLGMVIDNGDGTYDYDPNGQFEYLAVGETVTDTFSYTVDDGNGGTDAATVTITIDGANDTPTAGADATSISEDAGATNITAALLAGDTDPDISDTLTVSAIDTTGTVGTVTLVAGVVSYDPNGQFDYLAAGESATDTFNYTIDDGNSGTDTATVTVTINGANDTPTAVNDVGPSFATDENTCFVTANVITNDSDPDTTDVLTVSGIDTTVTLGTVLNNGDGTFTYDPNGQFDYLAAGETTSDTFDYTISDGKGGFDSATVTITINGANDAPTGNADSGASFTTDEDTGFTTDSVLTNDTDPDASDILSVIAVDTTGTLGSVIDNGDGTFVYDPAGLFENLAVGESATDTFAYTLSDGNGGTDTATVTITIDGVNDTPTADNDGGAGFATPVNTPFTTANVLTNDSEIDAADTLSVLSIDITGTLGTVVDNGNGTFDYTPLPAFTGVDTFTYTVSDGNGGTDTATVTIAVGTAGSPPVANDDGGPGFTTGEDTSFITANVLTNDTDPDFDPLSVISINTSSTVGTVIDNGDGTFNYDPAGLFESLAVGETATDTFSYSLSDGNGGTDTATVTITINGVNDAPTPNSDGGAGFATLEDTPFTTANVLTNDTDPDATDTLSVLSVDTTGTTGTVVDNGNGTFDYTPTANFNGFDTFIYTLSDGNGGTDTATVTISVAAVDDVPIANNDGGPGFTTDENTLFITGNVLLNDTDIDGDPLLVVNLDVTGTLGVVTDNGDGTLDYNPNGQFENLAVGETATDTFIYTVTDGNGGSDTATVTITINGRNDGPAANDDSGATFTTDEDSSFTTGSVLTNDSDPDTSDTLAVTGINTAGTLGSVIDNGNGTFTYDPAGEFESLAIGETATDTFAYMLSDGNGGTDTATVTITINGRNDAPTANANSGPVFTTDEDTAFTTGNVLANDTDPDTSDSRSVLSINTTGTVGIVTDNGDGTFDYDPNGQFENLAVGQTATDTFTYTVSDGNGGTDTATVTITIDGRNDTPQVVSPIGAVVVDEDALSSIFALGTVFGDVDFGDSLIYSVTSNDNPALAGASIAGSTLTLDYQPNQNGTATIVVRATDGAGAFIEDTINLTVNPLNDTPQVVSPIGNITVDEDDPDSTFDLNLVFDDVDILTNGDSLSYAIVSNDNATLVTASLAGNLLMFDYQPDQNGPATLVIRATDGAGDFVDETINLTVNPVNDAPQLVTPIGGVAVGEDDPDTTFDLNLVFDDVDIFTNADTLTYSVVSNNNPALVAAGVAGNVLTLDFQPDQFGTASIVVRATDSGGQFAEDTLLLTVNPVNDAPLATDTSVAVDNDAALNIAAPGVLTGASDVEGDPLTVTLVSGPATGIFTLNADGSFDYTPDSTFVGVEQFTFVVSDGLDFSDVATVDIVVNPTVGPPDDADSDPVDEQPDPPDTSPEDGDPAPVPEILPIDVTVLTGEPTVVLRDRPAASPAVADVQPDLSFVEDTQLDEFELGAKDLELYYDDPTAAGRVASYLATTGAGLEFVSITSEAFWTGLDQLDHDLGMQDVWKNIVVESATVLSVATSTGFVVWVLRGGYLLTFMISSLPAWMMVDPMAVLDAWAQSPQGSSGESKDSNKKLDAIFSDVGT